MTAYFDHASARLMEIRKELVASHSFASYEKLREWEQRLVWDVTLVASLPIVPREIADAIHATVLTYGMDTQPESNAPCAPDPEDIDDQFRVLLNLSERLHDVFHALASRGIPELSGVGDKPTSILRVFLFEPGDERRWIAGAVNALSHALAKLAAAPSPPPAPGAKGE